MQIRCPIKINALKYGWRGAIISDSETLTYKAFDRAIDYCAQKLKHIGIKEKERVCISAPANPEYIITLFALWRIGAVACLLSDRLPPEALGEQIKNVRGKTLFAREPEAYKNLPVDVISLESIVIKNAPLTLSKSVLYAFNQPATILFTSGSRALPKAVQHTFANHYYSALGSDGNIPVKSSDRWLLSLPLYHVSGLSILFRCFLKGAAVVISKNKDVCSVISKCHITHVSLVAAQLQRALAAKGCSALKKLKALLVGGSAMPEQLRAEARSRGVPLYVSYGLTEMASQVATTATLNHKGAKVLRYRKIRVAYDGEILAAGKTLFQGYIKNGALKPAVDKDGWFHTGDMGSLRRGGFLTVRGRKDAMFISGGENIFPEEIEYFLRKCALIEDAYVVAHPNQEYGFRPVAFIKIKKNQRLNPLALEKYLSKFLPKFKIPDAFYILPKESVSIGVK
ncbi:MAG: o-succinylbenzoate--CoA ligase [Candidatus Omnitrophota bacterium]|nr:o-succinylbenzoate--CoA ligase [Candidatus Omnitrophota bacterium]